MTRTYACVRQNAPHECAAAALATVAEHRGVAGRFGELRAAFGDRPNLRQMVEAARLLGLPARGVKGDYEGLRTVELPGVAHWLTEDGALHFVVVHAARRRSVLVADPARGLRRVSRETFERHWTGYMLLVSSPEALTAGPGAPRPSREGGAEAATRLLVDRLRRSADPGRSPAGVTTFGFLTRNRPESLRRSLLSYARNARAHGRAPHFVVADGSDDPRETRRVLESLRSEHGVEVSLAGPDRKGSFAQALAREAGVPPEVVEFALFDPERVGVAAGANRNALLLQAVGEVFVSADDDTECRISRAPEYAEGLRLQSGFNPEECWFYPDRGAALGANPEVEADALAIHEQMLGRELGPCIGSADAVEVVTSDPTFAARLWEGGIRIAVTRAGHVGDCGSDGSGWLHTLAGPTRDRIVRTEQAYRAAFAGREIAAAVQVRTVSEAPSLMTAFVGFDHREILPPFMPVGRGQDVLFGLTLRRCFERHYLGHLPFCILHAPSERRTYEAPGGNGPVRGKLSTLLVACIESARLDAAREPAGRMRQLGAHLRQIGSLPAPYFEAYVRVEAGRGLSASVLRTERLLEHHGRQPAYWAEDLHRLLERSGAALASGEFVTPADLLARRTPDEALDLARRLVFRFGLLLEAWPDLFEAARALRLRGVRPAGTLNGEAS